jgi:hypothetical protein
MMAKAAKSEKAKSLKSVKLASATFVQSSVKEAVRPNLEGVRRILGDQRHGVQAMAQNGFLKFGIHR